ncbi:hypothetical protein SAMN02745166_03083 [Prosthecobacter debontii]|uniref:Uncharacterized protein n=1 Tax=Prosthecobacter debontii TaxID=48467 RepID=A0A1T4YF38_9BACT|nr:hypothetical protein SAMN02745166_03083 [Prosthecobacter debontii]
MREEIKLDENWHNDDLSTFNSEQKAAGNSTSGLFWSSLMARMILSFVNATYLSPLCQS